MRLTYFASLALFLGPPLLILLVLVPRDLWRWLRDHRQPVAWTSYIVLLAHILMALLYTTPWDNYLVATEVWRYHPQRVSGPTIGYVPIEEYTFFVLQTLLTGLWVLAVKRQTFAHPASLRPSAFLRLTAAWVVFLVGITFLGLWRSGWQPGAYLSLILSWASLPLLIQLAFGADILWAYRRLIALAVLPPTLYLWLMDTLSIGEGIWEINPQQTLGAQVGPLPIEEMVFFLVTNLIIALGTTLMLSPVSHARAARMIQHLSRHSTQSIKKSR